MSRHTKQKLRDFHKNSLLKEMNRHFKSIGLGEPENFPDVAIRNSLRILDTYKKKGLRYCDLLEVLTLLEIYTTKTALTVRIFRHRSCQQQQNTRGKK